MSIFNIYIFASKTKHPPLGPGYLKAYAEKKLKNKVEINIKQLESLNETLNTDLYKTKPDMIGFSCYNNPQIFMELAEKLKRKFKVIKIVLGGHTINTSFYDKIDFKSVDYIVYEEGELTFYELLKHHIEKSIKLSNIDGLIYKDNNKHIINNQRKPILNLNEIPSPYLSNIFDLKEFTEFYIEGSRGCLYNCTYCVVTNRIIKYREFDIERLKKEIKIILENKNTKSIEFCDSDIFLNQEKAKKIFRFIKKLNTNTYFNFNTELFKINNEIFGLISDPRITFGFGIQTLTPQALSTCMKIANTQELKKQIKKYGKKILEYSYPFTLSFIYWLPYDNLSKFKNTIDFALESGANLDFFRLIIWKNTLFKTDSKKYKIKYSQKYPYNLISTNTYTKKDIKKTKEILKNILPLIKLTERDRFLHTLLIKYSTIINKKEKYLHSYLEFSSYIKRKEKNLVKELLSIPKFEYLIDARIYKKRLKSYSTFMKFTYERFKKQKNYPFFFAISNFITQTTNRLFIYYNIKKIINYIKDLIDIKNTLIINWIDIKTTELSISITDRYCDKTILNNFKYYYLNYRRIKDKINKHNRILFINVFSWMDDNLKKEIVNKKKNSEIIIQDSLNKEDYSLLKENFKIIDSYKIIKNINLYICR